MRIRDWSSDVWSSDRSKALFANIGYKLDNVFDGLRCNAGFRYTWDKISACIGGGTSPDPTVSPDDCKAGAPTIVNSSVNKTSSKAPTWTVGLDWQANRDLFLYVVPRRGYRSGGINVTTLAGRLTQFQSFAPEKVTAIEFGIRSAFPEGG